MKALKSFMITFLIVIVLGCIFIVARGPILKMVNKDASGTEESAGNTGSSSKKTKANPITKALVNEAIDTYVDKSSNEKVKEIAESMSEEDRDAVTEIIANNVSLDAIPEVQSYLSDGDTSGMMEYAEDNFSEEEIAELKDIMSKYVAP